MEFNTDELSKHLKGLMASVTQITSQLANNKEAIDSMSPEQLKQFNETQKKLKDIQSGDLEKMVGTLKTYGFGKK